MRFLSGMRVHVNYFWQAIFFTLLLFHFSYLAHAEQEIIVVENLKSKDLIELEEEFALSDSNDVQEGKKDNIIDSVQNDLLKSKQADIKSSSEKSMFHTAHIRALNKITAHSKLLKIGENESAFFGNIEIKVLRCVKKKSDPENAMILVIVKEHKLDHDPEVVFSGWLFSKNISVSTLEHPVYFIQAVDCAHQVK